MQDLLAARLLLLNDSLTEFKDLNLVCHAGAIPVFVGPPFHVMPFASLIDYQSVALIFNITGPRPWLDTHPGPLDDSLPLTLDAPGSPQLQAVEVGCSDTYLTASDAALQRCPGADTGGKSCKLCNDKPEYGMLRLLLYS